MGLFSGKKKTYVGTSVSRVIEDIAVPDIAVNAVINSIFTETSITNNLIDNINTSVSSKSQKVFDYARRGFYPPGLPNHTFVNDKIGIEEVTDILETIHDVPVFIAYHNLASLHNIHLAFQILHEQYEYDEDTNEIKAITNTEGSATYLENIVGIVNTDVSIPGDVFQNPNSDSLALYESAPNSRNTPWVNTLVNEPNWSFSNTDVDTVIVHYGNDDGNNQSTIDLGLNGLDTNKTYYQTKYYYDIGSGPIVGYFTYEIGLGTYPELDKLLSQPTGKAEFMPFIFFRNEDKNLTAKEYHDTELYKKTTILLDKMGMDYQTIGDAIHENPDIEDVQEAIMLWGTAMDSKNPIDQKYLYHFFNWVLLNAGSQSSGEKYITIEDLEFKAQYLFKNITLETKQGLIKVGTKVGDYNVFNFQSDASYEVTVNNVITTVNSNDSIYLLSHQITQDTYQEIRITNLELYYVVNGLNVVVNAEDDPSRLLIPINLNIAKQHFSVLKRNELLTRSMHFIFNSLVVQKLPWYTSGIFKTLLAIASVVIVVVTLGKATPAIQAAYAAYVALYGPVIAVLLLSLKYVATNFVADLIFSYVAQELGEKNTSIAVLVGVIGAVYTFQKDPNYSFKMLQASTSLGQAGSDEIQKRLNDYSIESQQFEDFSKEQYTTLENIQKELGLLSENNLLKNSNLIPYFIEGETSEEFYNRTLASGNVTTEVYEYLHKFVEITLQLPTVNETLKEFNNNV